MLGGYQILDLRSIDLSRGASESSISDASVLVQLLNIRDHIQKNYDFSKPLHNQLKPLLIRYRDKKVGEKHEVACYGNIEVINTYYKFRIIANNEGEQLTINVEFEEKTDEYDNKYWDIKTAKVLLTSAETTIANILAGGNVSNAKPIYCHPIYCTFNRLRDGNSVLMTFTCLIFNNDETPFTAETFFDWAKALFTDHPNASIMASGYVEGNPVSRIQNGIGSNLQLQVPQLEGSTYVNQFWNFIKTDLTLETSIFIDGVNKIN